MKSFGQYNVFGQHHSNICLCCLRRPDTNHSSLSPGKALEKRWQGKTQLLSIFACFWVNRKIEGVFIIHWWLSLCHRSQKSCGLLGCIPVPPLILVCAGTFPKSPPPPVSLYCQKGKQYFLPLQIPCKTLLMCREGSGFYSCLLAPPKPVPLSRSEPDMGVAIP